MASNFSRLWCAAAVFWLVGAHAAVAQLLPDFGNIGRPGLLSDDKVSLRAEFVAPRGDRPALLVLTADIAAGFHVYAADQGALPSGAGPLPTSASLDSSSPARLLGPLQPLEPPQTHVDQKAFPGLEMREHSGRVTWVAPVELPTGVDPRELTLAGLFEAQACNPTTCVPQDISFTARLADGASLPADLQVVVDQQTAASAPTRSALTAATPAPVAPAVGGAAYDLAKVQLQRASGRSIIYYLITAFVGGLILNVMPCVLPVIGLKVMSFVQQAGESRRRALVLNGWYAAGIVAVFMALAALAVTLQLGWGDQMGNAGFLIALTAVVFAMALSMLGLWEIPIPGFVSTGAVVDAAHREGAPAAFLKGALTTVLATPCTGPYMVSGIAWAVEQPPYITFSVFAALGAGMASPYLLIGAFPSLMRFLPKPGPWMETFKKAMGMLLLATVVWLLSALESPLLVPTFALLVGVTVACWWAGGATGADALTTRIRTWAEAAAMIALSAGLSFGWLYSEVTLPRHQAELDAYAQRRVAAAQGQLARQLQQVQDPLALARLAAELAAAAEATGDDAPWQEFSLARLGRLTLNDRRTVLVDFTADWCASCKFFEQTVLKTDDVAAAIEQAGIATMQADYTRKPAWMRETIRALGGIGVPVLAIFPADRPYEPIVFTGGYTKGGLLEAIQQATGGRAPARSAGAQTAARPAVAAAN